MAKSSFDDGYEFERGRAAFRRDNPDRVTVTMDKYGNFTPLGGLSLRDRFACSVLARSIGHGKASSIAARAYEIADAMLEARK